MPGDVDGDQRAQQLLGEVDLGGRRVPGGQQPLRAVRVDAFDGAGNVTAKVTASDVSGEPVRASAEPVTVTVLEPTLQLTQRTDRTAVRAGDAVVFTFTVTNTGSEQDGPLRDVRVTSPTLPPDCMPEPIGALAPGDPVSVSCTAKPDRTFDNQAFASGVDRLDRVMRVGTTPVRVTVTNPALTISTTAEPTSAKHDEPVDFVVTVRNIGDVPLTVAVTNDVARDCDLTLAGDGLPAGAASGVRCTVSTPADESATELTDVAGYHAEPVPPGRDAGPPLEGSDDATVRLEAGQATAPPAPGADPAAPAGAVDPVRGGTGNGRAAPGGAGTDQQAGAPSNLAWTGSNVVGYLGIGLALLTVGGLAVFGTRRRVRR